MPKRSLLLVIAALVLTNRATPQDSKNEQSAKPLSGYSVLVVQNFKVEPTAITAGFEEPRANIMRAEIVLQLVKKRIFDEVIDGNSLPSTQAGPIGGREWQGEVALGGNRHRL